MNPDLTAVKALTFDVFGTCVDFRASIIRDCRAWGKAKGLRVNWPKFADAWRAGYRPAMVRVTRGELPWTKIDALHRLILDDLLVKFKINDLTEAEKDHLNRVWHRLKPWPDTVKGLKRLKKNYTIATLSNGNTALLVNMGGSRLALGDCLQPEDLPYGIITHPLPCRSGVPGLIQRAHDQGVPVLNAFMIRENS